MLLVRPGPCTDFRATAPVTAPKRKGEYEWSLMYLAISAYCWARLLLSEEDAAASIIWSSDGSCTPLYSAVERKRKGSPAPTAGSYAPTSCRPACHFFPVNSWMILVRSGSARIVVWMPAWAHWVCSPCSVVVLIVSFPAKRSTLRPPSWETSCFALARL